MRILSEIRERTRGLLFRSRHEREMDDEIRFHLAMEADRLAREEGLPPAEARRRAAIAFGGIERVKEEVRDERGTRLLDDLARDVRHAARTVRRSPGFATVAVLTLALAIGANTALFSVVNGVLLRRLPYPQPDRLASVWPGAGMPRGGIALMREHAAGYEHLSGYGWESSRTLTGRGEPEPVNVVEVTPDLFGTLGVRASLGRTLLPGEDQPGRGQLAVLAHGFWERRLGGDPSKVGEALTLDGVPYTVVGIMPANFRFPSDQAELWVPATFDPGNPGVYWGMGYLQLVGRLAPGVTTEQASAELGALVSQVREAFPWRMPDEWGADARVVQLQEAVVGDVRAMLLVLLGAVAFVLLIACVNIANLMFARNATRHREVAVRAALGAGRGRLVRQLFTESAALAALGGLAGILLAVLGVPALVFALPEGVPRVHEIVLDVHVLGFAAALTIATAIGIGLLPALRVVGGVGGNGWLGQAAQKGGRGTDRRRLSSALVVAEVALAVVLVVGAGLMLRSFWHMLQVNPGFRTENVLTATVAPPEFRFADDRSRQLFYEELLARLGTIPVVHAAAVATGAPFGSGFHGSVFMIEGQPHPSQTGNWPWADYRITVSPGYHQTLGIPIIAGRAFADGDRSDAPLVALISRALADRYWPDEDPVGNRIRLLDDRDWRTVVGVFDNVKSRSLTEETLSALHIPLGQGSAGAMSVLVRTSGRPELVASNLRGIVRSLDRDTPVSDVRTMDELVAASLAQPRFAMLMLGGFAVLALLLGAIGVFGLLAYLVSQRSSEIGIRMALGARSGDVHRLVLWHGIRLALAGAVLGIVAALGATRVMAGMLYGVSPLDPATFAAVVMLLVLIASAASYLPARRAASVDPLVALRAE